MSKDPDASKGAEAQDKPGETSNVSMTGQNAHRNKGETMQGQDSDFPEPGENEEHSMENHTQHSHFGGDPGAGEAATGGHRAGLLHQADVAVVAPRSGDHPKHGNTIARENHRKRSGFHRDFHARAQIIQQFQNCGNISGAGMFVVGLENVGRGVAVVGNLKPGALQAIR